uniref:Uncharacterized protein n=1 Tax=Heterorhabditis bacteriophora TaxID=37862 RepID=A0A1I7WG95_HETBA
MTTVYLGEGTAKPIDPTVQAGTQVQQLINFVCVQEFGKIPIINIQFNYTSLNFYEFTPIISVTVVVSRIISISPFICLCLWVIAPYCIKTC